VTESLHHNYTGSITLEVAEEIPKMAKKSNFFVRNYNLQYPNDKKIYSYSSVTLLSLKNA
jgi:hypothetical protein